MRTLLALPSAPERKLLNPAPLGVEIRNSVGIEEIWTAERNGQFYTLIERVSWRFL